MSEVYLNSKLLGEIDQPMDFVQRFREDRRKGVVNQNANVFLHPVTKDIFIESNKGRARRPVLVVKDGKTLLTEDIQERLNKGDMTWNDLVNY